MAGQVWKRKRKRQVTASSFAGSEYPENVIERFQGTELGLIKGRNYRADRREKLRNGVSVEIQPAAEAVRWLVLEPEGEPGEATKEANRGSRAAFTGPSLSPAAIRRALLPSYPD
ncbi:hypothetical protein KM043_009669 [Ampulex compressa]|nr:hypothetical protein KM043_009669 [Ampulex compressa]